MKSRQISSEDRIALLGSSRGLGWATYQALLLQAPAAQYLLSSRKITSRISEVTNKTLLIEQDFSKTLNPIYLEQLQSFAPTILIYSAGGGPHGLFEEKKWSDHQWALQTSFLFPAELLHSILAQPKNWLTLRQVTLVGSAIAEDQPDALASSYAAAKHALKGLVSSIQQEASVKPVLKLFSPGYMQTDLLPPHSKPRQAGLAEDPHAVAKKLIAMIEKND